MPVFFVQEYSWLELLPAAAAVKWLHSAIGSVSEQKYKIFKQL